MIDARITREIDASPVAATLAEDDGRWTLTMQRRLRHPPERVWRMLTIPEELARWSPFGPDRELDSVGPATSIEDPEHDPLPADVLYIDPPRELVHRWGEDLMRWTLEADGDGTLLTMHHTVDDRSGVPSYASGWHLCFAVLSAIDQGDDVERVTGGRATEYDWETLRDAYDGLLAG